MLLTNFFLQHIAVMSRRFRIFFTPKFSGVTDESGKTTGDYKYFNKPFGVKFYLQHSDDFKWDEEAGKLTVEDDFVIILDPDVSTYLGILVLKYGFVKSNVPSLHII